MRLVGVNMDTLLLFVLVFWVLHGTDSQRVILSTSTNSSTGYQPLFDHVIKRRTHNSLTFEVKACRGVHVALKTSDHQLYEILIGGWSNTRSMIRRCRGCDHVALYNGTVVNCSEYKQFWMSFVGGTIEVGRGGTVGQDAILSYTDPNPFTINYFDAATMPGVLGEWIFDFCEPSLRFTFFQGNSKYDGGTTTDFKTVQSRAHCSVTCFSNTWCRGFSHDSSTNKCNMFDDIPETTALNSATGWETWIVSL